jgi:cytochrome c
MRNTSMLGLFAGLSLILFCRASGSAVPGQAPDRGIGPVKNLKLGPVDQKLAENGKQLFADKCAACHDLSEDKMGPALGNILKTASPEFVMNMLLNTVEMTSKDAAVKKSIAHFGAAMPSPGLSHDEARAILEYLRTTGK